MDASGARWFKSSRSSNATVSECVEVAFHSGAVLVRDSKQVAGGPVVPFSAESWQSFVTAVKAGDFDLRG